MSLISKSDCLFSWDKRWTSNTEIIATLNFGNPCSWFVKIETKLIFSFLHTFKN